MENYIDTLPDTLLSYCFHLSLRGRPEKLRLRHCAALQLVCKRFRRVVTQASPEIWHTVILPMYGIQNLTNATAFLAHHIPRNTIVAFSCLNRIPFGQAFLEFLRNHAGSLDYVGLYDVNVPTSVLDFPQFHAVVQGLSQLKTLSLTSGGHQNLPALALPPLPSLEKVTLDIKGADVTVVPDIIGTQPALNWLVVHAWRKRRHASLTGRSPCITPWLKTLASLRTLEITMKFGDAHEIFKNEDGTTYPTLIELNLTLYEHPTSYAFLKSFSHVHFAAVRVFSADDIDDSLQAIVLRNWVHIRHLSLKQINVGRSAECLSEMPHLNRLQLDGCGVHTLRGLKHNTSLATLWVYDDNLQDCYGVGGLQKLRGICLSAPRLTDASDIQTLRNLVFLGLMQCVRLRGLPWHISEFTQTLENVRLCAAVCSDIDAQHLTKVPNLKIVELEGGDLHGVGKLLESAVKSKATLKTLKWVGLLPREFRIEYPRATALLIKESERRTLSYKRRKMAAYA